MALASSWYIQNWAVKLLAPDRRGLWLALGLSGLWLALSALAGLFSVGMTMVTCQLLAGLLAAFGGRRTPAGRQAMAEVLGLRRYLKSIPSQQLQQICQSNPDYFYQMLPYALSLGVGKSFAKQFDKVSPGTCPYISTGEVMRGSQWYKRMQQILSAMNTRGQAGYLERLLTWVEQFIR